MNELTQDNRCQMQTLKDCFKKVLQPQVDIYVTLKGIRKPQRTKFHFLLEKLDKKGSHCSPKSLTSRVIICRKHHVLQNCWNSTSAQRLKPTVLNFTTRSIIAFVNLLLTVKSTKTRKASNFTLRYRSYGQVMFMKEDGSKYKANKRHRQQSMWCETKWRS